MTTQQKILQQNGYILGHILGQGVVENSARFYQDITSMEYPDIFIARKNKSIIGIVQDISELKATFNLHDINEISFKTHKYSNGKKNKYYDDITSIMLVFIPKNGWYEINVTEYTDGAMWYKEVYGKSLEIELTNSLLYSLQINSTSEYGDIEDENYERIKFYNPLKPHVSLLHKILENTTWNVGHVDASLWELSRSFQVTKQHVYGFLNNEVAEAFNCIFVYDTFTRTVNAFDLETFGEDSMIYLDLDTVVQDITVTCDTDKIKTCLYVEGGENIDIRDVNVTGTNKIYNLSYYLNRMSEGTANAYRAYEQACNTLQNNQSYTSLVIQIKDYITQINELKCRLPIVEEVNWNNITDWNKYLEEVDLANVTTWSECGLWLLETREKMLQDSENNYQEAGYGTILLDSDGNPTGNYKTYYDNHQLLLSCTEALTIRTQEIETANANKLTAINNKKTLTDTLEITNYFTTEQWEEIRAYIREDVYTNDSYMVLETDLDNYAMEVTQELYNAASRELEKYCKPQYSFETTIGNIFAIQAFKEVKKDFALGNYIRIGLESGVAAKLRLVSIEIDYDNPTNLKVAYSDALEVMYGWKSIALSNAKAAATTSSVSFYKSTWLDGGRASEVTKKIENEGFNADEWNIQIGKGNIVIGKDSSILLRKQKADGTYEPEQAKIMNNQLYYTDDNWKTTKAGLGKREIYNPKTGQTEEKYGLTAEFVDSPLIFTENFYLSNSDNSLNIDENGLVIKSRDGLTAVTINPNNGNALFKITKGYGTENEEDIFYTDVDGGLNLTGTFVGGEIKSTNYVDGENGTHLDLDEGTAEFSGNTTYAWLEKTSGEHIQSILLKDGMIELNDASRGASLYFTSEGISTTKDANNASGVIDFRSRIYGESSLGNAYNGVTIQSKNSPVGLRSMGNHIFINPEVDRADGKKFDFNIGNTLKDGRLSYGIGNFAEDSDYRKYDVTMIFSGNSEDPYVKFVGVDDVLIPVKVKKLQIGNTILTEDKLQRLLSLLSE